LSEINAPWRQVAVEDARPPPSVNVITAPSVPQPGRDTAELTSSVNLPSWSTVAVPQTAEPIIAVTGVPGGAWASFSRAVPITRVGGAAGGCRGVAVGTGICAPGDRISSDAS